MGLGAIIQDDDPAAEPGQAVTVLLKDDLSITRGDMLCRPNNRPRTSQELEAMLCWMDDAAPLQLDKIYTVKHTTKLARGRSFELVKE